MDFTSTNIPDASYVPVGPLFYSDTVVGVLDGGYPMGSVRRADLTGVRYEQRTSFKHPLIGLLLGVGLIAWPITNLVLWGNNIVKLTREQPFFTTALIAIPLMIGLYLVWGVARRRDVPWIVFACGTSEVAYPLAADPSPEALCVMQTIVAEAVGKAPPSNGGPPVAARRRRYTPSMHTGRLEAFSDGVIAIIITIMVLELRIPAYLSHEDHEKLTVLYALWPTLLSYVLSFIYLGIYWNNHHHLFQAAKQLNGVVLWANLNLLFWLSLIPFTTHWMGDTHFARWPVVIYGVVLLMCALSYELLSQILVRGHERDSALVRAMKKDWKDRVSLALYIAAIPLAWVVVWISLAFYAAVAFLWFIPDRRIEEELK